MRVELLDAADFPAALLAAEREIRLLVEGLDDAQLNWQPGAGKWSTLQVVEHLRKSADAYLPVLRTAISRGLALDLGPPATPVAGWIENTFLKFLASPTNRGPAPRAVAVTGTSDLDATVVLAAWSSRHRELIAEAERAKPLDPNRVRFSSPFFSLLRLRLSTALTALVLHELRHAGQIRRTLASAGFPGR